MYSGNAVFVGLRAVVLIILARLLTPEDYGLVNAALIFVNFTQLFSQLGVGPALIQRPELEERHLTTGFTVFTVSGLLFGLIVAGVSPLVGAFFQMDGLIPILWVAMITFPIQGFTAVPLSLMRRELRFRQLAAINVVSYAVGYGVVGIVMAYLNFGAWALVGAMVARVTLAGIIMMVVQPYPKQLRFERQAFNELMIFGSGFTIARLLDYAGSQGDNAVVGRTLGAAALGVYGRAFQLLTIPSDLFGSVLDEVLFPAMSKVQDDIGRLRTAFRYGVSLYALVLLPMSAFAFVVAPELVQVVLGPKWVEVVLPFQILVFGMLLRAGNRANNAVAHAKGAVFNRSWRQAIFAVAILGGGFLASRWGVTGVAVSTLLALLLNYLLMAALSISLTELTWRAFAVAHWPGILLSAITGAISWGVITGLRALALPDLVTLLVTTAVTGVILVGAAYVRPGFFLGPDGNAMLGLVTSRLRKKLKRPARVTEASG